MKKLQRLAVTASVFAGVILVGTGCASVDPDGPPRAGSCIDESVMDAIPFVDCGESSATRILVYEIGEGEACDADLEVYSYQHMTIAGGDGPVTLWCSGVPGELTDEQKALIGS
ncbi:hypothetical protein WJX64_02880 [Leifsonia sp. YIM 134122]|uniref:Secreted protein n=1 Tax=Leifsonia stereocauli TaxID=3134136 RepID=A0ABU9W0E3_9MICO